MKDGFIKLAAATPAVSVGAPRENGAEIIRLIEEGARSGASVIVFPELALTGYTCGDLFFSSALLKETETALRQVAAATAGKNLVAVVGLPLRVRGKLYNCAALVSGGHLLGVVPKTHLPNFGDFAELRWFAPFTEGEETEITLCGDTVWFSPHQVFACREMPELKIGCEIGADLWVPGASSDGLSAQGATVIANPAAVPETVGAESRRRTLVTAASDKLTAAYVYAGAGEGESTTDSVFGGHAMIAENGKMAAENPPCAGQALTTAVVDLAHLEQDRLRVNLYRRESGYRTVPFSLNMTKTDLTGAIAPHPFLPEAGKEAETCRRILEIQARGLAKRIRASRAAGCVIALSGGLDSTLALIVTVRAMDLLGRSRAEITAVTMPCFGTTARTRSNAERMALGFGTSFRCIDIKEAVDLHFRDIGHSAADQSVVYENAQARERTQIIMDIANADGSLVIGTGDLSELALGWATYNGDHMSNYGVNAGIPKTMLRLMVSCYAVECEKAGEGELAQVLRDVLDTPVSPELLPPKDGEIAQKTEDIVGPYDLHDFFLYHFVRWGESPDKIYREAAAAFAGTFDEDVIEKWLRVFLRRFHTQQFKRSALPDGPRVGEVSLSPRGAWQMPSDAAIPTIERTTEEIV